MIEEDTSSFEPGVFEPTRRTLVRFEFEETSTCQNWNSDPDFPSDANLSGDFWPFFDEISEHTSHWCFRNVEFDIDLDDGIVSEFHAYQTPFWNQLSETDPPDSPLENEITMDWFRDVISTDAVLDLLEAVFGTGNHPVSGSIHLTIWMEMHRAWTRNILNTPQRTTIGDETSSIPKVFRVCYS